MSRASDRTTDRARPPQHLVVGRVLRPHGVRGALLIEPLSQVVESLAADSLVYLGARVKPQRILSLQRHGRLMRMNLAGCRTREQAEAYRGDDVRLRLDAAPPLPPGRHYQWQILGLRVVTDDGNPLGHVRRILETGANDVYVVENDLGEELLLPAITSVIRGVDLEQGVLTAHLLPGLVDVTRRKVHREE